MIIATQTDYLARTFGDEEAIRIISENGFDAIDYSMFAHPARFNPINEPDYMSYALHLKKTAESYGTFFSQAHAPFPTYRDGDEEFNARMKPLVENAILFAGTLGAKCIIVHPIALKDPALQLEFNLEFYNSLLPFCEKVNIKIAVENMYGWNEAENRAVSNVCSTAEEMNFYLDHLDAQWFTACLDIGHTGMVGQDAAAAIRILGGQRLTAMHLHDNDKRWDLHTLPFTQSLDWSAIMAALKDIGYSGNLTFEADNFLSQFPPELAQDASRFMLSVGKYLAAQI